jgi:hypothetical protein
LLVLSLLLSFSLADIPAAAFCLVSFVVCQLLHSP